MRLKCTSNPGTAVPAVIAALCTASFITTAMADRREASIAALSDDSSVLQTGTEGAGIVEDFESFNLGAGCGQQSWTGFCGAGPPPVGFQITDESGTFPEFGNRSARHISDGSGIAGFEVAGPLQAAGQLGVVAADIVIGANTSLYQFITGVKTTGTTIGFNTRINFELNGTITALQTTDCATGTFAATTGAWTPGTVTRIGVEVDQAGGGPGSLKIYQDGVLIFTGRDIAGQCNAAPLNNGIQQIRNFASNAAGTAQTAYMIIDNVNDSLVGVNPCEATLPSCNADIAGPGGGGPDGLVGVPDLLGVINTWGQNGNPDGPRPLGDCAPLPNGDCLVGVPDLLMVINNWGSCPVPTGACCIAGACQDGMSVDDCANANGVFQGVGSECASIPPCPIPPNNDECANATVVNDGANNINNAGATTSNVPGPACTFGGPSNFTRDVWFTYTATCTGNLTADVCSTTGDAVDVNVAIYSGTCGNLTEIGCGDAECGDGTTTFYGEAVAQVEQGQTYIIRVGSWGTAPDNEGDIVLTISCAVFDNANCSDAPLLAIPSSTNGNVQGGGNHQTPACGNPPVPFQGNARWFRVTGTGTILDANLTGLDFFWTARLSVYCGSSCDSLVCIDADQGTSGVQVLWCSELDRTYWIAVHTNQPTGGNGQFTLNVSDTTVSCEPPVGLCGGVALELSDSCANAVDVTALIDGPELESDNSNATPATGPDPELPAGSPTCHWNNNPAQVHNTLWAKFEAPVTGTLIVETCGSEAPFSDSVIVIYDGTCGSLVEVGCGEDEANCGPANLFYSRAIANGLTPGNTYYIMVGSTGGSTSSVPGPFKLKLDSGQTPGACCVGGTCVGTMTNSECNDLFGAWTSGEECPGAVCDAPDCPSADFTQNVHRPTDAWTAGVADSDFGAAGGTTLARYEQFPELGAPITHLRVWGLEAGLAGGFPVCTQSAANRKFNIEIRADNNGVPGALICDYTDVVANPVADSGLGQYAGRPLWRYDIALPEPCPDLSARWIVIYGNSPGDSCGFLWMSAGNGNGTSVLEDRTAAPGTFTVEDFDLSICINP